MGVNQAYLAGPIANVTDGGHTWREYIEENYKGVTWRNPLNKYDVPGTEVKIVEGVQKSAEEKGVVTVSELVEADKDMINESDGMLVGWSKVPSVGTPMEVMYTDRMIRFAQILEGFRAELSKERMIDMAKTHVDDSSAADLVEVLLTMWDDDFKVVVWLDPLDADTHTSMNDVSPWMRDHADFITNDVDSAVERLSGGVE